MNQQSMFSTARKLKTPVIMSSILVLPFMILELINRRGFHDGFPVALFVAMWLLPLSFILILMPIVRSRPEGKIYKRLSFFPAVVLLSVVALFWVGLVIDQMPCFLGVPHCD